jgi:hypothetical protein
MTDLRCAARALALAALALPGCLSEGHLTLLGYSTKPLYNCNIKTVYVPIFKNVTSRDTVRQGIEFNLTRRVIEEIETKSHYKVVSDPACADSELLGTIVVVNKGLLNINQNNEIRMGQTLMNVEIIWRDRRTGEILSSPKANQPDALPFQTPSLPAPNAYPGMTPPIITSTPPDGIPVLTSPVDPDAPPLDKPKPKPALVSSTASYIPELGQSTTTSLQGNIDLLATQIVSMMEAPW